MITILLFSFFTVAALYIIWNWKLARYTVIFLGCAMYLSATRADVHYQDRLGERLLNHCSERMLTPGKYAQWLAERNADLPAPIESDRRLMAIRNFERLNQSEKQSECQDVRRRNF